MVDQTALKNIEELHRLKTEGLITEEDYEKAKDRLLFGGRTTKQSGAPAPAPTAAPLAGPWDKFNPSVGEHLGWIVLPLKRYADFNGRSSRKEFWMFQIIYLGLGLLAFMAFTERDVYGAIPAINILFLLAILLALLGLTVPLLAVEVRRLRDQDRSPWLVLINLVPYVGVLIVYALMLVEGTPGDNQYGPDPRAD